MTKSTRERLEAAIGVMYAEVRTSTELSSPRAAAKAQVEATLVDTKLVPSAREQFYWRM